MEGGRIIILRENWDREGGGGGVAGKGTTERAVWLCVEGIKKKQQSLKGPAAA